MCTYLCIGDLSRYVCVHACILYTCMHACMHVSQCVRKSCQMFVYMICECTARVYVYVELRTQHTCLQVYINAYVRKILLIMHRYVKIKNQIWNKPVEKTKKNVFWQNLGKNWPPLSHDNKNHKNLQWELDKLVKNICGALGKHCPPFFA